MVAAPYDPALFEELAYFPPSPPLWRRFVTRVDAQGNAHKNVPHISDRYYLQNAANPVAAAIYLENAYKAKIERCLIEGEFGTAVDLRFCLAARLEQLRIRQCKVGVHLGCGEHIWPDGSPFNASSNLSVFEQVVVQSFTDDAIGFRVDGAANIDFNNCGNEGWRSRYGWHIKPRMARVTVGFHNCWSEYPNASGAKCDTVIYFAVNYGTLVIDGMRLTHFDTEFLDATLAKNCTIVFKNNNWSQVPAMRIRKSCNVVLDPSNSFTDDQFSAVVERTGPDTEALSISGKDADADETEATLSGD